LLRVPAHKDIAMTGEITLRGKVLPIGGLKEKLLAAHRGLIKRIIIPKENEKDLKEIPKKILSSLKIIPVESMDEVLRNALVYKDIKQIFRGKEEGHSLDELLYPKKEAVAAAPVAPEKPATDQLVTH
jgi:ATP-dependent Lon protease